MTLYWCYVVTVLNYGGKIMSNLMDHFIDIQVERLTHILKNNVESDSLSILNASSYQIQIVGSGSSLNAAKATETYFERYTENNLAVDTPELFLERALKEPERDRKHIIFIAISQTASSIATMKSLALMRQSGAFTILITANKKFENKEIADCTLDLMAEEELIGPKSLGYTATVVRLVQLVSLLFRIEKKKFSAVMLDELAINIQTMMKIRNDTADWLKKNKTWANLDFYTLATSESIYAAGRECTLKLLEVVRKPAMEYELGEFTHGPHRLFGTNSGHIFIVEPKDIVFANKIAKYARSVGAKTLIISSENFKYQGGKDITIPNLNTGFELNLAIIFQTLANKLAQYKEIDADVGVFPDFFQKVGTKVNFKKEK